MAGPVSVVLIAGYFVSFAAIGSPEAVWARAVSFFPLTAPLAMPNRIAMGAAAWWEPVVAVVVALAAIAALVASVGGCTPARSSTPARRSGCARRGAAARHPARPRRRAARVPPANR